jgi:type IV pilus assembly protein PilV
MPITRINNYRNGFSLIEILVSVFILAVGLLGVASMQIVSMKMNQGAYHQSQANILANNIFDRIRLNRDGFLAGEYDGFDTTVDQGDGPPEAQACITSSAGCTSSQLALNDVYEITSHLSDIENLGTNFVAFIPDGRATIARNTSTAVVTISWEQNEWSRVDGSVVNDTVTQQLSITARI